MSKKRSGELVLNGGSMDVEATARAIPPSRGSHPGMVYFFAGHDAVFWLAVTMPDSWWIWVPVAVVILLLWRQQSRRDFYVVQHLVS